MLPWNPMSSFMTLSNPMHIEIQKSNKTPKATEATSYPALMARHSTYDVLVDGKRWGWFERYYHGPQGNSYQMRQVGGYAVRDETFRKSLTVYGDKMTARLMMDRPWHRPEISIEERLRIAAQYAVSKRLLRDPADIDEEAAARRDAIERQLRAEKAKQREADMGAGMDIADKCYPQLDDGYREHLEKLKLASLIADQIEQARRGGSDHD